MRFPLRPSSVNVTDQMRKKLRISSHLLDKSFMENFIFCAVKMGTNRMSWIKTGSQLD